MKNYICFITLLCLGFKVSAQNQFVLSGTITGVPANTYAKINYNDANGKAVKDSALITGDKFLFKGNISEPTRSYVGLGKNFVEIFIEPTQMSVISSYENFANLLLTGSKTNDENRVLKVKTDSLAKVFDPISKKINAAMSAFRQAQKNNASERIKDSLNDVLLAVEKLREPFAENYEEVVRQFVITHPASFISPIQMSVYVNSWPVKSARSIYDSFTAQVKNSKVGLSISKAIVEREQALLKTIAADFAETDVNGKKLKLSNFKGKYVLLDFWGSWCVPCRAEMPHAIETFKKYNKAGLEVLAIAVQDKTDNWKRAIKKDKTEIFNHVLQKSDKSGTPGNISGLYDVHLFPTKILIDNTGKIIARYEGGGSDELDKKLAEIFKAN